MRYEPVQKGNPHKLVIKQHIFPKRSIERFCRDDGSVDLLFLSGKRLSVKPHNDVFCVNRSWDERAERGYGKRIEDDFQSVTGKILQGELVDSDSVSRAVTDFCCLWQVRHCWSKVPIDNVDMGLKPAYSLSINEQEDLEKAHIFYARGNGEVPSRLWRGAMMQQSWCRTVKTMSGIKWGLLTATEGEFLVPDNFSNVFIVPVTPKQCFVTESDSQTVGLDTVRLINSLAVASAEKYVFARDLTQCPTL
jgi:hypothetical protein